MSIFFAMRFHYDKKSSYALLLEEQSFDHLVMPRMESDKLLDHFAITLLDCPVKGQMTVEVSVEAEDEYFEDLYDARDLMAAWLADGIAGWKADFAYGVVRDLETRKATYFAAASTSELVWDAYDSLEGWCCDPGLPVDEIIDKTLEGTGRSGEGELHPSSESHECNGREVLVWAL